MVRLIARSPVLSAIAGLVVVGISAAAVLLTGDANQNFLTDV